MITTKTLLSCHSAVLFSIYSQSSLHAAHTLPKRKICQLDQSREDTGRTEESTRPSSSRLLLLVKWKQESRKRTDVTTIWEGDDSEWVGKRQSKRLQSVLTPSHTPTCKWRLYLYPWFLAFSHTQTLITCLLSQCQSLERRQRDIGEIIIGKT